jgi:uncharacterized membrane protein
MKTQTYKFVTSVVGVVIAAGVGASAVRDAPIFAVASVIGGLAVLTFARGMVKGVLRDEMTRRVEEKSAYDTFRAFSILSTVTAGAMIFLKGTFPGLETTGYVIAYGVCGLLAMHSAFAWYHARKGIDD